MLFVDLLYPNRRYVTPGQLIITIIELFCEINNYCQKETPYLQLFILLIL